MKPTFGEVAMGMRFKTPHSKRLMTCLKVGPTFTPENQMCNAVILLDHTDRPAHDLGTLLSYRDDTLVEIDDPIEIAGVS